MSRFRDRICKAMVPFWRGVRVSRIRGTKLWRIEIPGKMGLGWRENKDCAYAILDALCSDFSSVCVVTVI
jgi:hypothetical protein